MEIEKKLERLVYLNIDESTCLNEIVRTGLSTIRRLGQDQRQKNGEEEKQNMGLIAIHHKNIMTAIFTFIF